MDTRWKFKNWRVVPKMNIYFVCEKGMLNWRSNWPEPVPPGSVIWLSPGARAHRRIWLRRKLVVGMLKKPRRPPIRSPMWVILPSNVFPFNQLAEWWKKLEQNQLQIKWQFWDILKCIIVWICENLARLWETEMKKKRSIGNFYSDRSPVDLHAPVSIYERCGTWFRCAGCAKEYTCPWFGHRFWGSLRMSWDPRK